ncbi:hypothetical protein [Oscillibacter hominis]|uniref:hypothetical protein n=1 Tax=Oscillibacter hominis TaxID=2763056 RepID=UPI001FAE25B1|nr:hypothetical protein [Oscillibacter hominis]
MATATDRLSRALELAKQYDKQNIDAPAASRAPARAAPKGRQARAAESRARLSAPKEPRQLSNRERLSQQAERQGRAKENFTRAQSMKPPSFWERTGSFLSGNAAQLVSTGAQNLGFAQAVGNQARKEYTAADIKEWQQNIQDWTRARDRQMAAGELSQEEIDEYGRLIGQARRNIAIAQKALGANEQAADALYAAADTLNQKGMRQIETAKQGMGGGGRLLVDVGSAGIQMTGDIALGKLTSMGGLAPMAGRVFAGATQEARQEGADMGRQFLYGLGSATVSVATEQIGTLTKPFAKAFGKGASDKVIESLIEKAVSRFAQTPAGKTALIWPCAPAPPFWRRAARSFWKTSSTRFYAGPPLIRTPSSTLKTRSTTSWSAPSWAAWGAQWMRRPPPKRTTGAIRTRPQVKPWTAPTTPWPKRACSPMNPAALLRRLKMTFCCGR